ncbi:MAG: M20/M25/M40 family metallo-hydrolase [Salinivirgaceae bacterium]|nr:M20/M25/M40 family metallo-hydrolase [Salinivirgaceae bacterium]
MKNIQFLLIAFAISAGASMAQDSLYIRGVINQLCSEKFAGRGYVNHGDAKAAKFLSKELEKKGVLPFSSSYFQEFSFPMNTFPGDMNAAFDSVELSAVADYVVSPDCPSIKGTYGLVYLPASCDTSDHVLDSLKAIDFTGKIVVAPFLKRSWREGNPFRSSGWVIPKKSIYWWASTGHEVAATPLLLIRDSALLMQPKTIRLAIENHFIENHKTQNVLAFIHGAQIPDSFIVFTAHYDHLGRMGKGNLFTGANDNASGTTMLLALANYFTQKGNKPKYSIAFLFFAAEEAGLLGSIYYVEHPVFPLSKIKTLINLDMVGSGSEGISVVNGEANPNIVAQLNTLNQIGGYLPDIKAGGESCNSDHCFFHKAGVPSVFIFTRGPECKEYHNLKDTPANLPLTKFWELQSLLIKFTDF